jgi:hypothetical protein
MSGIPPLIGAPVGRHPSGLLVLLLVLVLC